LTESTPRKFKKHPWFKRKGYLHFDFALPLIDAEKYVTRPDNILRHRFSPLIHYGKISRKVKRNILAEKAYKAKGSVGTKPKLLVSEKSRNIFYVSHIDGYIYSYYTSILQKAYEQFLLTNNLTNNVIAYRSIRKNGTKFCNSHLANEAFDLIRASGGCHVLCFDLSKFFDTLSMNVLKQSWAQVLGVQRLSPDHFKVFQSLEGFCFLEEGDLIENIKGQFDKNPRQHGLDKKAGGSLHNKICDYPTLRALDKKLRANGKPLIQKKTVLDIMGIPQGTPISGLLSNVFMISFDIAVKKHIEGIGGHYRRYSDDIFIMVPTKVAFEEVERFLSERLKVHCGGSIALNQKKTEKRIYAVSNAGVATITAPDLKACKIQYLGFHFDGKQVFIRNSSISKDRAKIIQVIRQHKKRRGQINTTQVFKRRSLRAITPYDNKRSKGFAYYADRSATAHGNSKTIAAQIKKNDAFIKKAIKRERIRNVK